MFLCSLYILFSAYEDVPFDDSAYNRRVYPLHTLDRSADPLTSLTYQKKTNPPTSAWQVNNEIFFEKMIWVYFYIL